MRKSIAMIELIITIVVIAIAMLTIPTVLMQVSKSDEFTLNQEAILAGATKIGNILTYKWDENIDDSLEIRHILDVSNGDNQLDRYPDKNSTYRVGGFKGEGRRKFYVNETNASITLGVDSDDTSNDDIDDFDETESNLTINSQFYSDYVKDFRLKTKVYYIDDIANYEDSNLTFSFSTSSKTSSTNIKLIEVKVIDNLNGETIANFRSYATNIGSVKLLKRTFY